MKAICWMEKVELRATQARLAWAKKDRTVESLLSAIQLPQVTQGYWTEHSERAVIPTGLSVLETPPADKDILGNSRRVRHLC